jgi:DNA replication protein DnaC
MLNEQTFDKLHALKLVGMAEVLKDQLGKAAMDGLSFEERFALLVDAQYLWKDNKRTERFLKNAKLKLAASMEDIDYRSARGLDKSVMLSLANCDWVRNHRNVIIVGPTGIGKTYLSCALAQRACRVGMSAFYTRSPKLYYALAMARADGSYARMLAKLAKTSVLVIDDLGMAPMTQAERNDLLEVIEDRHGAASTVITSQLRVEHWHEVIGDPTIADAILDRLVHNAHKIMLQGDSMRKKKSSLTQKEGTM